MEEKEKQDLIEWFEHTQNEIKEVVIEHCVQLARGYMKIGPGTVPKDPELLCEASVQEFLDYLHENVPQKQDSAAILNLYCMMRVFCYKNRIKRDPDLTYQKAIAAFQNMFEDLWPLLIKIGQFDKGAYHRENVMLKGAKTRKEATKTRVAWIRTEAEKYWSETETGFEIATKRWEGIVEAALDREDIGVSPKTLGNYRRKVEDLLKKEGGEAAKIDLKRKSVR